MTDRRDELSEKFTREERDAYQWLWDSNVRPWTVDLLTKRVKTCDSEYASLVAFRRAIEES